MPYSSPRPPGVRPTLIVGHTGEGILDRFDMARFLDNNPNASAHAASDAGGCTGPLVPDERAAWTAGPTGNSRGLHIEMCAFVAMSRAHWLSEQNVTVWVPHLNANRVVRSPLSMVRHTARWMREKSDRWGIPLVKLTVAEVRAGRSGVCGHADISYAFGETTHTDPQPHFPWDVAISLARGETPQEEDDMTPEQDTRLKNVEEFLQIAVTNKFLPFRPGQPRVGPGAGGNLEWVQEQLGHYFKAHPVGVPAIDYARLADEVIARGVFPTVDAIAKAVIAESKKEGN